MFIGLKTMPLGQQIEQSHGITEMGLKVSPTFVCHMLEMTNARKHGKDGFDEHTDMPLTAFTQAKVAGMPIFLLPTHVGEDNHLILELFNDRLKGRAIIDIGRVTIPSHNQTEVIEDETEFTTNNPAPIGFAFLADLFFAASFPPRMQEFNAITVDHADERGFGQKVVNLLLMTVEQPK